MSRLKIAVLAAVLTGAATLHPRIICATAGSQSAQARAQPKVTVVDPITPPATLRGMWDAAQLVVHGVVTLADAPRLMREHLVGRYHQLKILEVLKPPASSTVLGNAVRVMQYGGTVVINREEVSTGYPEILLQEGEEYLLFLVPSPSTQSYEVAFGSAGAFAIDRAGFDVRIPSAVASRMPEFSGRKTIATADLLKSLRALRDSR